MKIVFWGAERGCRTRAHMFAVAGMMRVLCAEADITVSMQKRHRAGITVRAPEKCGADIPVNTQKKHRAVFYFYDGGTGCSVRREHMLRNADLVVANLKSRHCCVERFFMEHGRIPENTIVLLGGDRFEAEEWRGKLEHIYRIGSGQTGWISYSEEFHQALMRGEAQAFIRQEYHNPGSLRNEQFLKELETVAEQILRRSEEQKAPEKRYSGIVKINGTNQTK